MSKIPFIITNLGFQTHNYPKLSAWFFKSVVQSTAFYLRRTYKKNWDFLSESASWQARIVKKILSIITNLRFDPLFSENCELEFFDQGLNRQLHTWGGLFSGKIIDLDLCVGKVITDKMGQKMKLILKYSCIHFIFFRNCWLDCFYQTSNWQLFLCKIFFELNFLYFCTSNRFFLLCRKCRKVQVSKFLLIFNLIVFWRSGLEVFQQGFNRQLSI